MIHLAFFGTDADCSTVNYCSEINKKKLPKIQKNDVLKIVTSAIDKLFATNAKIEILKDPYHATNISVLFIPSKIDCCEMIFSSTAPSKDFFLKHVISIQLKFIANHPP